MNIRIQGFTPLQQAIADMVWSLDTEEELLEWYHSCADDLKPVVFTVMSILRYEAMDQEPIEDFSQALEIIEKVKEM